jgi:hypothetical protein
VLSSNAFLARILANENAETFGSLDCGISILIVGAGIVGATTITSGSFLELLLQALKTQQRHRQLSCHGRRTK